MRRLRHREVSSHSWEGGKPGLKRRLSALRVCALSRWAVMPLAESTGPGRTQYSGYLIFTLRTVK